MEDGEDVARLRNGHHDFLAEDIARFAEIAGDCDRDFPSAIDSRAVDDLVVSSGIDRRPRERVKRSAVDAGEKISIAFFHILDADKQRASVGDQKFSRFDNNRLDFKARAPDLAANVSRVLFDGEGLLLFNVARAESSAEIQKFKRETFPLKF